MLSGRALLFYLRSHWERAIIATVIFAFILSWVLYFLPGTRCIKSLLIHWNDVSPDMEEGEPSNICPGPLNLPHVIKNNCSFLDAGFEHDLALTAQLGRELLDRNSALEKALEKSQREIDEKDLEIKLLLQRISELNELTQRKCILADEADWNSIELCRVNRLLTAEMEGDKKKIGRLSARIVELEHQANDLWDRLERCTCNCLQRSRSQSRSIMERPAPLIFRSISPSPVLESNVKECNAGTFVPHWRSTAVGCLFIDDELIDQPLLGACSDSPSFCYEDTLGQIDHGRNPHKSSHITSLRQTRSCTSSPIPFETSNSGHFSVQRCKYHNRFGSSLVPVVCVDGSLGALSSNVDQPKPEGSSTGKSSRLYQPEHPQHSEIIISSGDHESKNDSSAEVCSLNRSEVFCSSHAPFQLSEDYQPQYKQLFRDTFLFLQNVKSAKTLSSNSAFLVNPL